MNNQYLLPLISLKKVFPGLIMILYAISCSAQSGWAGDQEWKYIFTQHKSGKISDSTYLLKAQILTEKSFKDPDLKSKLSHFQEVAWSDTSYQAFRIKYYAFLANQTTSLHQDGFAIYYLEKMESELQKVKPYINSLNQPRLLLSIYGNNEESNHDQRIAIIDSIMPFMKSLPQILKKQSAPINTCINAFTILKHASQLYLARNDTSNVLKTLHLSRQIWKELEKKKGLDEGKITQCRLSLYLTESNCARILSRKYEESEALKKAYQVITFKNNHLSKSFRNPFERTILSRLIEYHIYQNQIDSANYYYEKFKNKVASYDKTEAGDGTKFLLYSGKIQAQNLEFEKAYQDVLRAYELNDSIISIRTADIQNNMYAHFVAEKRSEALAMSERQKQTRNLAIYTITALMLITIWFFIWKLHNNRSIAKQQIADLNKITQIQIAEMEANTNLIQKRMGMELHDDIAGRLVNICNYINGQIVEEQDPERKSRLESSSEMVRETYTNTRLKSHEWYYRGLEQETADFSYRVRKIVDQALPDNKYDKTIEIDDQSLSNMSPETRIHILRIIQEAVANILKHAKASQVKLFLYKDEDFVVLQLSDNGKGFDVRSNRYGVGMESLKDRIKQMNGSLEILSSDKGTELLFTIP